MHQPGCQIEAIRGFAVKVIAHRLLQIHLRAESFVVALPQNPTGKTVIARKVESELIVPDQGMQHPEGLFIILGNTLSVIITPSQIESAGQNAPGMRSLVVIESLLRVGGASVAPLVQSAQFGFAQFVSVFQSALKHAQGNRIVLFDTQPEIVHPAE